MKLKVYSLSQLLQAYTGLHTSNSQWFASCDLSVFQQAFFGGRGGGAALNGVSFRFSKSK